MTEGQLEVFADAWNRHDVDAIMSFFSEDCVFIAGWGAKYEGMFQVREGVSEFLLSFLTADSAMPVISFPVTVESLSGLLRLPAPMATRFVCLAATFSNSVERRFA